MNLRILRALEIAAAILGVVKVVAARHRRAVGTRPVTGRRPGSKKSRQPAAPLLSRIGSIACLIFAALAPLQAAKAADGTILRGIASTAQPVSGATILLYDGSNLLQSEPYHSFYNGTFSVQLNEAATHALISGGLRVDVVVNQTTTLIADLGVFDPATQVIFVNPVTTITAAYRNLKRATAAATAEGTVAEALGVGSPAAVACQSTTGFNGPMVSSESVSSGGFNAYMQSVARQIAQGQTPSLRGALGVPQDPRDFFLETAAEIFGEAFGGFPGTKPLAGWILGQIFNAPDETPEELQQIKAQLSNISSQLNEVLAGISRLSAQIYALEQSISDQIKRQNYQNDAATVQTYINFLCNMQQQLMFLAAADPHQNNTKFADTLQAEIQSTAGVDLSNMWSELEGNGGVGTRSLLNEWSDAVGAGPGSPIFANVGYLTSAVPNLQYYLGAMLVGYNLQIEQAHWLQLNGAPDLAKSIIERSSADFEQHDDVEMKLVAHNQEIGGPGTTGLYAAVLPPFFAAATQPDPKNPNLYSTDPTNAYNWAIDTRSGLLWMRSRSCDGANCTFAQGGGVALAQPYIGSINTTLNQSYPGELLALTAPSRAQWISLLRGFPKFPHGFASQYLASIYFFGVPDKRNPAYSKPDYDHFWTSDIGREMPGIHLFWHVDTSRRVFGCCEPSESLELVSAAPLTDPYHFLYRSHQDDFSMNVFTSGPAMGVASTDATATALPNGKVLIAGGIGGGGQMLDSAELYDPGSNAFVKSNPMNAGRYGATAVVLPDSQVLIAGGGKGANILSSTELYTP
ncbi:MAG: kelch repeat-containing protein [Stellaceae bacterium]